MNRFVSSFALFVMTSACFACAGSSPDPSARDEPGADAEQGATSPLGSEAATLSGLPGKAEILASMQLVNDAFIAAHPDPGNNQWARAVYFTGDLALYKISAAKKYYDYADGWAKAHAWGLHGGAATRSADDQVAGEVYLELNELDPAANKVTAIKASLDGMVQSAATSDWWWVDALNMAMPPFTRMGLLTGDTAYFDTMYALYHHTKTAEAKGGLYDAQGTHLWWRDGTFKPPYQEPNGKGCFWSRGNGWAFAAHARVLDLLPTSDPHRAEYITTFQDMAAAIAPRQRADGFWNVSLDDPTHFAGPETSGTAFFAYGIAWGLRRGLLDAATYGPVLSRAWSGLVTKAVHPNGLLGYVQGVGLQPSSSQPVTANSTADFGVGAFLLAGSQLYQLTHCP